MITCTNCRNPVAQKDGKVIFKVFVCPTCFGIAETIYRSGERGLKNALTLMQETIYQQLVDGKLQLPEKQPDAMTHTETLKMIVWLQEAYDVARNGPRAGDSALHKKLPGKE